MNYEDVTLTYQFRFVREDHAILGLIVSIDLDIDFRGKLILRVSPAFSYANRSFSFEKLSFSFENLCLHDPFFTFCFDEKSEKSMSTISVSHEPVSSSLPLPYKPYGTTFARIFLLLERQEKCMRIAQTDVN